MKNKEESKEVNLFARFKDTEYNNQKNTLKNDDNKRLLPVIEKLLKKLANLFRISKTA